MKKPLLLLITVLAFSITNAQEKQNDATWEETVSFLEENIIYLNYLHYSYKLLADGSDVLEIKFNNDDLFWTLNLKLKDIKTANIKYNNLSNTINVYAFGKVVKVIDGEVVGSGKNLELAWLYFDKSKIQMAKRIAKALKQIAYYNHQRRKQSKF